MAFLISLPLGDEWQLPDNLIRALREMVRRVSESWTVRGRNPGCTRLVKLLSRSPDLVLPLARKMLILRAWNCEFAGSRAAIAREGA